MVFADAKESQFHLTDLVSSDCHSASRSFSVPATGVAIPLIALIASDHRGAAYHGTATSVAIPPDCSGLFRGQPSRGEGSALPELAIPPRCSGLFRHTRKIQFDPDDITSQSYLTALVSSDLAALQMGQEDLPYQVSRSHLTTLVSSDGAAVALSTPNQTRVAIPPG